MLRKIFIFLVIIFLTLESVQLKSITSSICKKRFIGLLKMFCDDTNNLNVGLLDDCCEKSCTLEKILSICNNNNNSYQTQYTTQENLINKVSYCFIKNKNLSSQN